MKYSRLIQLRYHLCHALSTMGNCMYLRMTFSRIQLRETQLLNTVAMYYHALRPVGSCMLFRRTVSYIFSARSISEWISSCSLYCSAPTYQPPPTPEISWEYSWDIVRELWLISALARPYCAGSAQPIRDLPHRASLNPIFLHECLLTQGAPKWMYHGKGKGSHPS